MSNSPIHILYIDDEPNNVVSFRATFRREFNVYATTSINEAFEMLEQHPINIIISDQKMPDMSGTEFLAKVIEAHPNPIRMLLTGFADLQAVIDAINKGNVFRYISKPWNADELRITIRNAFEMYSARTELAQKNEALQKAYNELEKFVYSASHDLRAPLASIMGVVKLARAEGQDDKYLGMIDNSAKKLDAFVKNIISYYQNSKQELVLASLNIDQVLDEVIETYAHMEGATDVKIEKSVTQPAEFVSDMLRVKVVLNNLVSNAIKYRDPKKDGQYVKIETSVNDQELVMSIADNGLGIGEEGLPKIFEMFYRHNNKGMGTGIGLYLVKETLAKLGGEIEVESTEGAGTTFTLRVPNHVTNDQN